MQVQGNGADIRVGCSQARWTHLGGSIACVRPHGHEAALHRPRGQAPQLDPVLCGKPVAGCRAQAPVHHAPAVPAGDRCGDQAHSSGRDRLSCRVTQQVRVWLAVVSARQHECARPQPASRPAAFAHRSMWQGSLLNGGGDMQQRTSACWTASRARCSRRAPPPGSQAWVLGPAQRSPRPLHARRLAVRDNDSQATVPIFVGCTEWMAACTEWVMAASIWSSTNLCGAAQACWVGSRAM